VAHRSWVSRVEQRTAEAILEHLMTNIKIHNEQAISGASEILQIPGTAYMARVVRCHPSVPLSLFASYLHSRWWQLSYTTTLPNIGPVEAIVIGVATTGLGVTFQMHTTKEGTKLNFELLLKILNVRIALLACRVLRVLPC